MKIQLLRHLIYILFNLRRKIILFYWFELFHIFPVLNNSLPSPGTPPAARRAPGQRRARRRGTARRAAGRKPHRAEEHGASAAPPCRAQAHQLRRKSSSPAAAAAANVTRVFRFETEDDSEPAWLGDRSSYIKVSIVLSLYSQLP